MRKNPVTYSMTDNDRECHGVGFLMPLCAPRMFYTDMGYYYLDILNTEDCRQC